MIYTSNYHNCRGPESVSISGDRGAEVGYCGICAPQLAPKRSFWMDWHNNVDNRTEEENLMFYMDNYYCQVLAQLDPQFIYDKYDNHILLCYEQEGLFCHRYLVSAWLELMLGKKVHEIRKNDGGKIVISSRENIYLPLFEKVIRKYYNMGSFNSLRAAYLFNKISSLERTVKNDDMVRDLEKLTTLCQSEERRYNDFHRQYIINNR